MKSILQLRFSTLILLSTLLFNGCAVSEEARRIEQVKHRQQEELAGRSEDLTGEQVFVRSCSTCHPGGKAGLGPTLAQLDNHFPTDKQLAKFIRTGKGQMPPQPPTVLRDKELANLIEYVRSIHVPPTEATPESQSSAKQSTQ